MMKKIRIITACIVLISMLLSQISFVTAEGGKKSALPVTKKHVHKPFWLFTAKDREVIGNKTATCYEGSSFIVFDNEGNIISEYVNTQCQNIEKPEGDNNTDSETSIFLDEALDVITDQMQSDSSENEADDFLNDLFGTSNSFVEENTIIVEENQQSIVEADSSTDEINDLLDGLFGETDAVVDDGSTSEVTENTVTDVITDTSEGEALIPQEDTSDAEIDSFLQDLFSINVINKLEKVHSSSDVTLSGKALSHAITSFSHNKKQLQIGQIQVNGLIGQGYYNSKVASLLHSVDGDFKIDSIKNDFAKNVSNLSYSLSTYLSDENNSETTEAFRKKVIIDMKQLQKKYRVLKNKDYIISKSLALRSNG